MVADVVTSSAKREVEEAKMPTCAKSAVEVAEVFTPKLLVGVKGNVLELQAVVLTTPDALTVRHCPADAPKDETVRLVVEAVEKYPVPDTVSAVEEA